MKYITSSKPSQVIQGKRSLLVYNKGRDNKETVPERELIVMSGGGSERRRSLRFLIIVN
jgi:hypothetical protein